jgi:hypothetical protein
MTQVWFDLLRRKSVYDVTGNGINHPNDFGHRLYAQVILSLLVEPRLENQLLFACCGRATPRLPPSERANRWPSNC